MRSTRILVGAMALALLAGAPACDDDDDDDDGNGGTGGTGGAQVEPIPAEGGLDPGVCDPATGTFSLTIDNPFFPLGVGMLQVYEGTEDGEPTRLEIRVLDETEDVAGVTTRVVEERDFEGDRLVEVSRNFFAQAADGSVCYFGEEVDEIAEDGTITHPGEWRAEGGNQAGIIMPADPAVGDFYSQEVAPGIAEDRAEVVALGEPFTTPAGSFTDTLRTREWSPLEPDVEEFKRYARGVGLIDDNGKLLITEPLE